MLKIALVDDDSRKNRRVGEVIDAAGGSACFQVVHFTAAAPFLESARSVFYDLVLLDLHIPFVLCGDVNEDNAIQLLHKLLPTEFKNPPGQIVLITAKRDLFEKHSCDFSGLFHVFEYSELGGAWAADLKLLLVGLLNYRSRLLALPPSLVDVDCLFVTALATPELDQLKSLGCDWQPAHRPSDPFSVYSGCIEVDGMRLNAIASSAPAMGMTPTTSMVTTLLARYRPRVAAMTGICAGISSSVEIGDCILAEESWDYQSGKLIDSEGGPPPTFRPDGKGIPVSGRVRRIAESLAGDKAVLEAVAEGCRSQRPSRALKMHIGPLGSGGAIVQSREIIGQVTQQKRKALGIDMEAFGFMYAMQNGLCDGAEYFCVKAVSDKADLHKADSFQACCAYYSAALATKIAATLLREKR
jgi:nucleoside phosphorylase